MRAGSERDVWPSAHINQRPDGDMLHAAAAQTIPSCIAAAAAWLQFGRQTWDIIRPDVLWVDRLWTLAAVFCVTVSSPIQACVSSLHFTPPLFSSLRSHKWVTDVSDCGEHTDTQCSAASRRCSCRRRVYVCFFNAQACKASCSAVSVCVCLCRSSVGASI